MNKNNNKFDKITNNFVASTYLCDGVVSDTHFHNVYEVYYLEKGSRNYLINGKNYPAYPGTFILIPPGVPHQTSGSAFKRRLIHFNKSIFDKIFDTNYITKLLLPFEKTIFISPAQKNEQILNMFNFAETAYKSNDTDAFVLETAKLLNFISTIPYQPPQQNASNLLNEIESYIQENASNINTLEDITNTFFISKYYLCHLFKQKKNTTIMSYIMDIKIQKAALLLISTTKTISEISILTGFNSEGYFSKCFTSALGIPPSKYRKKFRNILIDKNK